MKAQKVKIIYKKMKNKIEYTMSKILPVLGLYLIILNALDFLTQKSQVPNMLSVFGLTLVLVSIAFTKSNDL